MPSFRIVLIEPRDPRNVGMVARAMANLGFDDLALVAPRHWDPEQAAVTARNALPIVDAARIVDDFDSAIAGCVSVAGFALRTGIPPTRATDLVTWARSARNRGDGTVALVYGPEDDDLRNVHLDRCRHVVRIPTDTAYPSFNLAQSVLVTLWELVRDAAEPAGDTSRTPSVDPDETRALALVLEQAMDLSGFRRPGSPAGAARTLAAWVARESLDPDETRALTALLGRIGSALRRAPDNP